MRQGFVELVLRRSLEVRRMLARSRAEGEGWGAVVSLLLLSASAASRWDVWWWSCLGGSACSTSAGIVAWVSVGVWASIVCDEELGANRWP